MRYQKWDIDNNYFFSCSKEDLYKSIAPHTPELGYIIFDDNDFPMVWQWHICDKEGFIFFDDDLASVEYWETNAKKHLNNIAEQKFTEDSVARKELS